MSRARPKLRDTGTIPSLLSRFVLVRLSSSVPSRSPMPSKFNQRRFASSQWKFVDVTDTAHSKTLELITTIPEKISIFLVAASEDKLGTLVLTRHL